MNSFFNFVLEANFSLAIFLGFYIAIVRGGTDFNKQRIMLIAGMVLSIALPLLHFENSQTQLLPRLENILPTVWLPEVTIGTEGASKVQSEFSAAFWLSVLYTVGMAFFLVRFLADVIRLAKSAVNATYVVQGKYRVFENPLQGESFSFFSFIHIGNAHIFSEAEKRRIIAHECIHAERMHSLDILLVNILTIFFWFNPVLRTYRKILTELHEFEADARAVENEGAGEYCNLLAKVALMSADLRLANYFTNSLTLKRIEMIRTIKTTMSRWQLLVMGVAVPSLLFFAVSCQEQVTEFRSIAENSSMSIDAPEHVQNRLAELQKAKPDSKFIMVEFNAAAQQKLDELEKQYGLPKSMEVFKNNSVNAVASGSSESGVIISPAATTDERSYAILEYNKLQNLGSVAVQENGVYTIVDESAMPADGIESLYRFISQNLRYPEDAKKQGLQGKVFVEFIVEKDGTITNAAVAKGIDPLLDQAATDIVRIFPKWKPGKQAGAPVRQKMVLPVNFSLD